MTEHQPYEVLAERPRYEIRKYPAHWVVEMRIAADFESAGNAAFRRLVGYIGGNNEGRQSIAMTAPVVQKAADSSAADQVVSFVLPASMVTPPAPTDPNVTLRLVPSETAAAARFSGRWTLGSFDSHARRLLDDLAADGVATAGPMRFARFDPPWTPWFMRHNEAVIAIADTAERSLWSDSAL